MGGTVDCNATCANFSIIDNPLVLQRVQLVPPPKKKWQYLFYDDDAVTNVELYTDFVQTIFGSSLNDGRPHRIQSFASTLLESLNTLREMLEDFPRMYQDLQFLLDAQGTLHNIDLDRCWETNGLSSGRRRRRGRFVNTF